MAFEALSDWAPRVELALFARERVRDVAPDEALTVTADDLYA